MSRSADSSALAVPAMTWWRRPTMVDAGALLLLVAVVLGPLLVGRGVPLVGDMVFVPDQPWKESWLGLDGAVPRFVPGEAVVWALGLILPGDWVPRLLIGGALLAAGWGMRTLLASAVTPARWTAMAAIVWNPWVYERLAIGQWPMLIGLAALPWLVHAALRQRRDPTVCPPALLWGLLVSAVASPPSGVMATALAVVLVAGRGRGLTALKVLAFGVMANLAWIVPSVVGGGLGQAPPDQFEAFALQAESALGAFSSALSGGGIWKESVVPAERELVLVVLVAALVALVAVGCLAARARAAVAEDAEAAVARRLLVVAGVGLVGATLLSWGPLTEVADRWAQHLPALGFLRDAHRWLAPWLVAAAWGAGLGVQRLWQVRIRGEDLRMLASAAPILPMALLPSMVCGMSSTLRPVQFPAEWSEVAALPAQPSIVLPWRGTYRGFAWNDHRAMLDPAPRMFAGPVLIDDRVFLDETHALPSEDPQLQAVHRALSARDPARALLDLGIERVIVEKNIADPRAQREPVGQVVHDGTDLRVIDLGTSPVERPGLVGARRMSVIAADVLLLGGFASAVVVSARSRRHIRRTHG